MNEVTSFECIAERPHRHHGDTAKSNEPVILPKFFFG